MVKVAERGLGVNCDPLASERTKVVKGAGAQEDSISWQQNVKRGRQG